MPEVPGPHRNCPVESADCDQDSRRTFHSRLLPGSSFVCKLDELWGDDLAHPRIAAVGVGAKDLDEAGRSHSRLQSVDIPAVSDASTTYDLASVINDEHDAVVPDPDAPEIFASLQLSAPGRRWIDGLGFNSRDEAGDQRIAQAFRFFAGGRLDRKCVASHAVVRV